MKLRHVLISAGTALLAFALLPASSASALDDAVCIDERTEQISHHFETTVHHYCNRWSWNPPKVGYGSAGGDHDTVGGKGGGTADTLSCDEIKESLANLKEALDLVNKQLDSANTWLADVMVREILMKVEMAEAIDDVRQAAADVDFWATAYRAVNDLDEEVEVTPKHGVTIVKQINLHPTDDQTFGAQLLAAMKAEEDAKYWRDVVAANYLPIGEELNDAHGAVANLTARRDGLTRAIENLQGQQSRC